MYFSLICLNEVDLPFPSKNKWDNNKLKSIYTIKKKKKKGVETEEPSAIT